MNQVALKPIEYVEDEKLPAEFKGVIWPYIHLVPSWVRQVNVSWNDSNTDCYAGSNGSYRYRTLDFSFFPAFLSLNERERTRTILHEIAHFHHRMIHESIDIVLRKSLGDNNEAFKLWFPFYEREAETFIEDLANLLEQAYYESKNQVTI